MPCGPIRKGTDEITDAKISCIVPWPILVSVAECRDLKTLVVGCKRFKVWVDMSVLRCHHPGLHILHAAN